MTERDIVERLDDGCIYVERGPVGSSELRVDHAATGVLMAEGAAEIKRLRERVAELERQREKMETLYRFRAPDAG